MNAPIHTVMVLLLMFFSGCKKQDHAGSELKWGHVKHLNSNFLIYLPPNANITVCGDHREETVTAIRKWAAAIGRDRHLSIDASCVARGKIIWVYGADKASQNRLCSTIDAAAYAVNGNQITICKELGGDLPGVLLHEAGHLWGLCDQYPEAWKNCNESHKSAVPSEYDSVMGYGAYTFRDLQPDDITGLRKLSERTDIAVNRDWSRLLSQNGGASSATSGNTASQDNAATNTNAKVYTQCVSVERYEVPRLDVVVCDAAHGSVKGAMITVASPGGTAQRWGLDRNHLILTMAGQRINSGKALQDFMRDFSPASGFEIQYGDLEAKVRKIQVAKKPDASANTAATETSSSQATSSSNTTSGSNATNTQPRAACLDVERFHWRDMDAVLCNAVRGTTKGIMVTSEGRGQAAELGLKPGDLIGVIDQRRISNESDLRAYMEGLSGTITEHETQYFDWSGTRRSVKARF